MLLTGVSLSWLCLVSSYSYAAGAFPIKLKLGKRTKQGRSFIVIRRVAFGSAELEWPLATWPASLGVLFPI